MEAYVTTEILAISCIVELHVINYTVEIYVIIELHIIIGNKLRSRNTHNKF